MTPEEREIVVGLTLGDMRIYKLPEIQRAAIAAALADLDALTKERDMLWLDLDTWRANIERQLADLDACRAANDRLVKAIKLVLDEGESRSVTAHRYTLASALVPAAAGEKRP